MTRIHRGEHHAVSANVRVTWASRLVHSAKLLSLREQSALLALAADVPSGPMCARPVWSGFVDGRVGGGTAGGTAADVPAPRRERGGIRS